MAYRLPLVACLVGGEYPSGCSDPRTASRRCPHVVGRRDASESRLPVGWSRQSDPRALRDDAELCQIVGRHARLCVRWRRAGDGRAEASGLGVIQKLPPQGAQGNTHQPCPRQESRFCRTSLRPRRRPARSHAHIFGLAAVSRPPARRAVGRRHQVRPDGWRSPATAATTSRSRPMWFNVVRHRLGFPYWPLSAYLKHKVKNAVGYIGNYENAVVAEARRRGVDGGICGPHRRIGKTDFSSAFKAVTADKISSQKGNPTFIWTLSWSYRQQSVWSKRIWGEGVVARTATLPEEFVRCSKGRLRPSYER